MCEQITCLLIQHKPILAELFVTFQRCIVVVHTPVE